MIYMDNDLMSATLKIVLPGLKNFNNSQRLIIINFILKLKLKKALSVLELKIEIKLL